MLTDASALKELIPPPSLYSKVLNAATSALSPAMNPATQAGPEGRHTLSSAIPWRRNGLKYPAQEVYFDVVEEIGGIIDKWVVPFCFCLIEPDFALHKGRARSLWPKCSAKSRRAADCPACPTSS
jgi:hypothetical protein